MMKPSPAQRRARTRNWIIGIAVMLYRTIDRVNYMLPIADYPDLQAHAIRKQLDNIERAAHALEEILRQ